MADSFGIELAHPRREKQTHHQVAAKGLSNHRWIIGAKLCVLTDDFGRIVAFDVAGANVHDTCFHSLIKKWEERMIVLADQGFKAKHGNPSNLKICRSGGWNERMIVETVFSLLTMVMGLKKLTHPLLPQLKARLAYTYAVFNLCLNWNGTNKSSLNLAHFKL